MIIHLRRLSNYLKDLTYLIEISIYLYIYFFFFQQIQIGQYSINPRWIEEEKKSKKSPIIKDHILGRIKIEHIGLDKWKRNNDQLKIVNSFEVNISTTKIYGTNEVVLRLLVSSITYH